jgi:hypothetical protein
LAKRPLVATHGSVGTGRGSNPCSRTCRQGAAQAPYVVSNNDQATGGGLLLKKKAWLLLQKVSGKNKKGEGNRRGKKIALPIGKLSPAVSREMHGARIRK